MHARTLRLGLHSTSHKLRVGLLVGVIALFAAGYGISAADAGSSFSSDGLSFDYPAAWHTQTQRLNLFTTEKFPIVALSPQPLHNSCKIQWANQSQSLACRLPLYHLRPNSVLVMWFEGSAPEWTLAEESGQKIKVDGITSKWSQTPARKTFPYAGATVVVDVYVPVPKNPGYFCELFALVRGPDTKPLIAQLRAMLASTHVSSAATAG